MPQPVPRPYIAEFVDRRLLRPLPWTRPPGMLGFHEAWIARIPGYALLVRARECWDFMRRG